MTVKVIVGSQWGDEGKGKITDILAANVDYVVRYQGGNNAGHTVCVGEDTFKLHLIPSGVLYEKCGCVIGNGVVLDPAVFFSELETLAKQGITVTPERLKVSSLAHVILPYHKMIDSQQEAKRHEQKIGTTGRGIGPAYTDKVARMGIRVQDLMSENRLRKKLEKNPVLGSYTSELSIDEVVREYTAYGQQLAPFMVDASLFINTAIDQQKNIILEGAQGTMLDVDHGTYPFVTSSNPISGGACVGVGIGPHKIDGVIGVTKAYVTRVGEGPFPTELTDEIGQELQERGGEFGTTTGRVRRCGWLDLVGLRYAVRVNGLTEICFTKLDVLDGLSEIKVCVGYETKQGVIEEFPLELDVFSQAKPVYKTLPGGQEDISQLTDYDELPKTAKEYVKFVSDFVGVPIRMISVGTRRRQTIHLLLV